MPPPRVGPSPALTLVLVGLAVERLRARLGLAAHEDGEVVVPLGGAGGVDDGGEADAVQAQRRFLQRLPLRARRQALPVRRERVRVSGAGGERRGRGGERAEGAYPNSRWPPGSW